MIGTSEVIIICAVIVLLFGASALPKFARNIGKARTEFQKGMKEARDIENADLAQTMTKADTNDTEK
ncbi:MAG: Sec-independent protein translocase subunit TatA/TatB [Sphaerochaeta sp.]